MDLFKSIYTNSLYMLPVSSFALAFLGSFHCVGMCGIFSMQMNKRKDLFLYHFGRLLGYLVIGTFTSFVVSSFIFKKDHPLLSHIPALLLGFFIIWLGLKHLREGVDIKIPFLKKIDFLYAQLNSSYLFKRVLNKGLAVGLLSVFLPCGLFYTNLIVINSYDSFYIICLSIFTFWLGTIPLLIIGPTIIQKYIIPKFKNFNIPISFIIVLLGLVVILYRSFKVYQLYC